MPVRLLYSICNLDPPWDVKNARAFYSSTAPPVALLPRWELKYSAGLLFYSQLKFILLTVGSLASLSTSNAIASAFFTLFSWVHDEFALLGWKDHLNLGRWSFINKKYVKAPKSMCALMVDRGLTYLLLSNVKEKCLTKGCPR